MKTFPLSTEDVIKNIIEEILSTEGTQRMPAYIIDKLNLDIRKEQHRDRFCKNKLKEMKTKTDPNFTLDVHSILKQVVKLKYTVKLTTVVPKRLTSLIILEFYDAKGHQGIGHTDNMMRHYSWWIGMQKDVHQHINTCKLCFQFLSNRVYTQLMHLEIPQVPFTGCAVDCI